MGTNKRKLKFQKGPKMIASEDGLVNMKTSRVGSSG